MEDLLLLLTFNTSHEVVGVRTLFLNLDGTGVVKAHGAIAIAICSDGIGGALEQVRARTAAELVLLYQAHGNAVTHVSERIDDDNHRVLSSLKQLADSEPSDDLVTARYAHALTDRPRWEALFVPDNVPTEKVGSFISGNDILVYPDGSEKERGFNTQNRQVFEMTRTKSGSVRSEWCYKGLGTAAWAAYADRGLFDKTFIHGRMVEALNRPPES